MLPRLPQVLGHFLNFKMEQWLDRDSLEKIQKKRLERILSAAYRTGYYRRAMDGYGISVSDALEDLGTMPFTLKRNIQHDPDSFIREAVDRSSLLTMNTSGSTGTPLELYMDRGSLDVRIALKYMMETSFGLSPRDVFAEISHKLYKPHPLLSATRLFRRLSMSVFEDEQNNYSMLRESRADVLGWYPSTISIMASLNQESKDPLKLKSVFCGSELLTNECRKSIEESFSCKVFNQYGATECATIAWECPEEHSLHVSSSSCLVEIVDSEGRPKPSGTGEIVVTNLYNDAMPLIRYRIGDRGSWGKECPCGRSLPVLKTLEGRTNDIIVLPSGRTRSPITMDIMYDVPGVRAYQIVQEREDLFVFRYMQSTQGFRKESEEIVLKKMRKACLGEEVAVEFEETERIRRSSTGKLNTIISKVKARV
jgi:phenylacetate-CoA ligase